MTAIIFLEASLPLQGVPDVTDRLVNYHVHATQSRFAKELEVRLTAFAPIKLERFLTYPWPYTDYKAAIANIEAHNPVWSIRDDRILLFMDDFVKLVGDARLLWVDSQRSRTAYEKELQGLNRRAFDKFVGPKLHLTENDSVAALKFALEERG